MHADVTRLTLYWSGPDLLVFGIQTTDTAAAGVRSRQEKKKKLFFFYPALTRSPSAHMRHRNCLGNEGPLDAGECETLFFFCDSPPIRKSVEGRGER